MGPLFTQILVDQFTRLRAGDRFFYLNESFNQDELRIMQQGNTLGKVIEANTNITNLQSDVFLFQASISGTVTASQATRGPSNNTTRGLSGVTIQLEDTSGNVLATTVTGAGGQYSFNIFNGIGGTGVYQAVVQMPANYTSLAPTTITIPISRGGQNMSGENFQIASTRWSNHSPSWYGPSGWYDVNAGPAWNGLGAWLALPPSR
jgi:hypothetical protein